MPRGKHQKKIKRKRKRQIPFPRPGLRRKKQALKNILKLPKGIVKKLNMAVLGEKIFSRDGRTALWIEEGKIIQGLLIGKEKGSIQIREYDLEGNLLKVKFREE